MNFSLTKAYAPHFQYRQISTSSVTRSYLRTRNPITILASAAKIGDDAVGGKTFELGVGKKKDTWLRNGSCTAATYYLKLIIKFSFVGENKYFTGSRSEYAYRDSILCKRDVQTQVLI